MELGVGVSSDAPVIFEEGAISKRWIKKDPEIELINFQCEEDSEKVAITLYMKKYRKLFRYLFSKYANTCYSEKINEFDALKQKTEIITLGELTKVFKDHNVTHVMMSREDLATILRLVNSQSGKIDIYNLTFEGFQECFVQAAIYIYSKPPKILSNLPLVESVKELVKHFEKVAETRGENTVLYTTPDVTTLGDKDLLKELNKMIKINPNYPLPEGYRKVTEKEANFVFKIKPSIEKHISESKKVVLEIIDEIIYNKVLGVHIIEPLLEFEMKAKVYPDIVKPQKQSLPPRYMEAVEKKVKAKDQIIQKNTEAQLKKRIIEDNTRKLPGNMKLIVSQFPKDTRETAKEVAGILDEMIEAVENNRKNLVKKEKYNKVLKNKEIHEEEVKRKDITKEVKRRVRHNFLKQKIIEVKKKEAEVADKKKQEEEEKKQKEKQRIEKEKMEWEKEREKTKKKLKEMKEKKEEERMKIKKEEEKKHKEENEKRTKEREEFLKKKKDEIVYFVHKYIG